jgi:hypothetical protein
MESITQAKAGTDAVRPDLLAGGNDANLSLEARGIISSEKSDCVLPAFSPSPAAEVLASRFAVRMLTHPPRGPISREKVHRPFWSPAGSRLSTADDAARPSTSLTGTRSGSARAVRRAARAAGRDPQAPG